MNQYGFPFNAVDDDRIYDAEDFAIYFANFISNGVMPGLSKCKVVTGSNAMSIAITPGAVYIKGVARNIDANHELSLSIGDGVYPRIDRVVARYDAIERAIKLLSIKGTPSSTPSPPALTRTTITYDICLAEVLIAKGALSITASNITDMRIDETVCGFAKLLIDLSDYSALFTQQESQFSQWFDSIKNQLSADPAGNLQLNKAAKDYGKTITLASGQTQYTISDSHIKPDPQIIVLSPIASATEAQKQAFYNASLVLSSQINGQIKIDVKGKSPNVGIACWLIVSDDALT